MPPRTRLRPEQRRAQLIETAATLYATRGYEDVSLDDVAAAAGCSRQLVYHYFPAKRELLRALVRLMSSELLNTSEPRPELPVLDQLRLALDNFFDFAVLRSDGYRAMLALANSGDTEVRAIAEQIFVAQHERLLAALPDGVASAAVALAVRGWLAFLRTTTVIWLENDQHLPRETLHSMASAALLGALLAVGVDPQALA